MPSAATAAISRISAHAMCTQCVLQGYLGWSLRVTRRTLATGAYGACLHTSAQVKDLQVAAAMRQALHALLSHALAPAQVHLPEVPVKSIVLNTMHPKPTSPYHKCYTIELRTQICCREDKTDYQSKQPTQRAVSEHRSANPAACLYVLLIMQLH